MLLPAESYSQGYGAATVGGVFHSRPGINFVSDANLRTFIDMEETAGSAEPDDAPLGGGDFSDTNSAGRVSQDIEATQQLDLDGVNQNIRRATQQSGFPCADGVAPTGGLAYAAWVNMDTVANNDAVISADGSDLCIRMRTANAGAVRWRCSIWNSTPTQITVTDNDTIVQDEWYHVLCQWDDTVNELNMYVDSVLEADQQALSAINADAGALTIGASQGGGGNLIDGAIDEVVIFDRNLTAQEIDRLFQFGAKGLRKRRQ